MERTQELASAPARKTAPGLASVSTQTVAKIASAVAAQSSMTAAAETIVTSLIDVGATAAYVLLLEPENERLVLAAQKGLPASLTERLAVVPIGAPLVAARAIRSRGIELVPDVAELDPRMTLTHEILRASNARALVAVPLIALGALVGVLTWLEEEPIDLGADQHATIKAVAEVFAQGIVNAHNVSALQHGNRRFEEIIDAAPIGMALVALDGRFVKPNRALCEMVGYAADELTKLRFQDITHPDDLAADLGLAQKLAEGEIPRYSLPKRYIRKDGTVIDVVLYGSAVRAGGPEDAGPATYFIAQIVDVTQQKQHEAALLQSEERFRLLAENARDLIYRYRVGANPGFEYVSPSATRLTGYTPEEHYADPQLGIKIIHPDDRAILQAMADKPEEAMRPLMLRWVRKDGRTLWVEQVNTPVIDAQGRVVAIEGIARDVTDRKQAEEALIESEERLRFIVEHSPDAIFIQDRDLRYVWVANTLPGYDPDDFLGKTEFDMLPVAEAAKISTIKRQVMASGESHQATLVSTYKGRKMYLEARYSPWRDRMGRIIGVAGFTRDVTQAKQTEDALRASEESLRMAQRVAHIGSWDWDLVTDAVRWSDEVYKIFGMEPQPVTFASFMQYVLPEDRPALEKQVREALSGGGRYGVDHRITRPDGQVRVIHEQADVIGEPGAPVRMIGTAQDVTELRALEAERERLLNALASEKQWMETLIESSPIGILLIDRTGKVRPNKRAEELFGHAIDREKGAEQYAHQICAADGRPVRPEDMPSARILRGELVERLEYSIRKPDGSSIRVVGSATPIFDEGGSVSGGVGVFEDVTALRQAERMREEWLGVIAHDLRQPLAAMAGNAELLKLRCGDKAGLDKQFDALLGAIERMSALTQELLDASVIEAKRLKITGARHDLRPLTTEILERAKGLGGDLAFTPGEEPVLAYVDAGRYEQILFNLISNAVKYGKAGRPIRLSIGTQGQQAVVAVANEGQGIAEKDLSFVFERFKRTAEGKVKASGLGLGLYIVKGLVEAHGGKIWVESTPGATTTFTFTLPIAAPQ